MPTLIRPFAALRPPADRAAEVIAPPYDVVSADEARSFVQDRPWSFLHVSRPDVDLPAGADPYTLEAYDQARENMRRMLASGYLRPDAQPAYYAYRISKDGHVQTGVAAAALVAAYESGRIRRHELTRPDKELDRFRQIQAVGAHTGPVFTTHRRSREVADVLAAATAVLPDTDVEANDGSRHQVWAMVGADQAHRLTRAFENMDAIYVADGHHRAAAAMRVAAARRSATNIRDTAFDDRFLIVSFPAEDVKILDYNRVVRDLGQQTEEEFLGRLADTAILEPLVGSRRPARRHEVTMLVGSRWYRLLLRPPEAAEAVARLDVSLLQRQVLEPLLGIGDPRTDPRIDFVGGGRGLEELERRVASGAWAVAFALYPTDLADLMAVADAGQLMPPKSTWFEPKLADGLISLPLGQTEVGTAQGPAMIQTGS